MVSTAWTRTSIAPAPPAPAPAPTRRLERMEAQLQELARQVAALAEASPGAAAPVPRNQERLKVGE